MLDSLPKLTARVKVEAMDYSCPPAALMEAVRSEPGAVLLESASADGLWGRYSVVGCRPMWSVSLRDGLLIDGPGRHERAEKLTGALRRILGSVRADAKAAAGYSPGWIGLMSYEMGRHFERLPGRAARDTSVPDMQLGFYDALAVHDAASGRWQMITLEWEGRPAGAGEAGEALRAGLNRAESISLAAGAGGAACGAGGANGFRSNFTREEYCAAVSKCMDYIAAGDIFQVNLSQRFSRKVQSSAWDIYRQLRGRNPAWYAGFMSGEGWAVASSSPELFLRVRDGHVVTRPIKGTRRRSGEAESDSRRAAELASSAKDNAELAMIIDLLRNDLGRVCRYGSVRVSRRRELEAHPTVYHLVGEVEGRLHDGKSVADLVRATFPGGSITGAPKIRAMEIIDELEPCARGVYTGSLCHFGVDGSAEMSIAIRSVVWDGGVAHVQAGGGIVADSTPEGEYEETVDKARVLIEAVEAAETECAAAGKQATASGSG